MKQIFKSIQRSWKHHFVTQLSTLIVLCGAFTVVVSTALISENLGRVLSSWGESLQVTAYLEEDIEPSMIEQLQAQLQRMAEIVKVEFVDREQAVASFRAEMASFAPGLLDDTDLANPFPASFRLTLQDGSKPEKLREVSEKIKSAGGVEEVSYGTSWISNYSTFASVISNLGHALVVLLIAGGAMIVANAVRASVAVRREDVEILELVGATKSMIRTPFLVEGALLGFVAAAIALAINFIFFTVIKDFLSENLSFMRFTEILAFTNSTLITLILVLGTATGFFGAYFAVRSLNDGWAASKRGRA